MRNVLNRNDLASISSSFNLFFKTYVLKKFDGKFTKRERKTGRIFSKSTAYQSFTQLLTWQGANLIFEGKNKHAMPIYKVYKVSPYY
jgi:hypothetical protein